MAFASPKVRIFLWCGLGGLAVLVAVSVLVTASVRLVGTHNVSSTSDTNGDSTTEAVHRVDTEEPVVFLTIDDGASRTPEMIDELQDSDVPTTLFLTDDYVQQDPEFFRELRDRTESTIENHTLDHPNLSGKPYEKQREEICKPSDRYEDEFGRRPVLFRPPYGSYDDTTLRAAADCGAQHLVHWSAEVADGELSYAAGDELVPGDIVLMHFRGEFSRDLAAFLDQAEEAGLRPALLTDYLD